MVALSAEKWYLVTSIDDYSRMLLYADFIPSLRDPVGKETSWVHILAVKSLVLSYGIPVRYYVDSLSLRDPVGRVFRFVQGRDSIWRRHVLETDDVETQWQQMMHLLGIEVTHALSPQAKGKVERPYRWLQDRIVRTCALENVRTLQEARSVLQEEVQRYNHHQVHSTTREIPAIRFEKAIQAGLSLFRPFCIPKPYNALEDVFCLRLRRMVDGYRRISFFNHTIEVPHVPLREDVDVHLVPHLEREIMHIRIWRNEQLVHTVHLPLQGFTVHF